MSLLFIVIALVVVYFAIGAICVVLEHYFYPYSTSQYTDIVKVKSLFRAWPKHLFPSCWKWLINRYRAKKYIKYKSGRLWTTRILAKLPTKAERQAKKELAAYRKERAAASALTVQTESYAGDYENTHFL